MRLPTPAENIILTPQKSGKITEASYKKSIQGTSKQNTPFKRELIIFSMLDVN
jgi:hypothetical protein